MEKISLPGVAVDGTRIRTIREAKKLTQLYVASVVGVTTDTISRWENNRYPTIKKDNAEKLASALEVELPEILRQEKPDDTLEEPQPPQPKNVNRRIRLLALAAVGVILMAGIYVYRHLTTPPAAERKLPRFGAPGETIPVQIRIDRRGTGAMGLIIKERLPAGWRLLNSAPPAATGQGSTDEVKWLIPGGSGPVAISYTLQIAASARLKSEAPFSGEIVAHAGGITRTGTSGGDRAMIVDGIHWADANGDGRIDDNEIMPAYYQTEEMKGLGLDWQSIESIWSSKGYRWDQVTREFLVVK